MTRTERTKQFNSKIDDDYFYRVFNYVKNNCHKPNIHYILKNYKNLYDKLEYIDMVLDLDALKQAEENWDQWGDEPYEWLWLDWKKISTHKDLNIDFLLKHQDKDLQWREIYIHDNLSLEWIEKFPNKSWDWIKITKLSH